MGYALHRSRSHDALIRVYDDAGNMIETDEQAGDFKESGVFPSHQVAPPAKPVSNVSAFIGRSGEA